MNTKIEAAAIMLLCVVFAPGCSELGGAPVIQMGERSVQEISDTVAVVGGTAEDTTFFRPKLLTFIGDGIALWDQDRAEILFFSTDGDLRWRYGGRGSGPGEFAGVTQIAADDQDRLWVLDTDNDRISLLDTEGQLIRAFRLPDVGRVDRLAALNDGRAVLMGMAPMLHVIDDHGNLQSSRPHPYDAYTTLHPISGYNRAVYDPETDSIAFFFYYGGGFARTGVDLSGVATLTPYIENTPFPEVTVQRSEGENGSVTTSSFVNASRLAAKSGSADDGVLHLLFEGETEYGHRLIDRYAIGSGDYLGSWILPDTTRAIAVHDGLVATLVENPFPTLVIQRTP